MKQTLTRDGLFAANRLLRNLGDPPESFRIVRLAQMRQWALGYLEMLRSGMFRWCR
jgi:hypothetical protein